LEDFDANFLLHFPLGGRFNVAATTGKALAEYGTWVAHSDAGYHISLSLGLVAEK
jgi:hypothetical protein